MPPLQPQGNLCRTGRPWDSHGSGHIPGSRVASSTLVFVAIASSALALPTSRRARSIFAAADRMLEGSASAPVSPTPDGWPVANAVCSCTTAQPFGLAGLERSISALRKSFLLVSKRNAACLRLRSLIAATSSYAVCADEIEAGHRPSAHFAPSRSQSTVYPNLRPLLRQPRRLRWPDHDARFHDTLPCFSSGLAAIVRLH
jgi:hypothetical protein